MVRAPMSRPARQPPVLRVRTRKADCIMNTTTRMRWTSRDLFALFILGIIGGVVLGWTVVLYSAPAYAADSSWTQPYGGCDEAWQAPQSTGAQDCRDHGWVVRHRLVVGPHHWVHYSTLPSCTFEDGSGSRLPCSWNFRSTDGNGVGDKFYVTGSSWNHHRVHYVNGIVR